MYHFLYKTTNILTGKYYIGAHSTKNLNDGYLGSGKQLKNSIKKYGSKNFKREILNFFEERKDAFIKESEIVTEDFITKKDNYNMCVGGLGAILKTEEFKINVSKKLKGRCFSENHKRKISLSQTGEKNHRFGKLNPNNPKLYGKNNGMFGKKHKDETKKNISKNRKNTKVNYTLELKQSLSDACKGKKWYNDGNINKRYFEGFEPENFIKGRLIKIRKEMGVE